MNERIRLLADQAMNYATDRLSQTHGSGPDFVNDFREKFAELIVKECAWAADFADGEPGDYIFKHFGVEE